MDDIDFKDLYEHNVDFKNYVDKYCFKNNIKKEQAFTHVIVIDYAKYLINPGKYMDWYLENKNLYK